MKITILSNRDLASNLALNYLLRGLGDHRICIFLSDSVGNVSANKPPALVDLQYHEQQLINNILFPALDANINQQFNKNNTRHLLTFNGLAKQLNASIESLNGINQLEGIERVKQSEPDLILSIRYGKILGDTIIRIPRHGVLNLHSSRLPNYQGVMATFWAMLNNEQTYGTTLHYIDSAAIDAGPIVNQTSLPLNCSHSYLQNLLALYPAGCAQMLTAVEAINSGEKLTTLPQQSGGNYFSFPQQDDLDSFIASGLRLVDTQYLLSILYAYQK